MYHYSRDLDSLAVRQITVTQALEGPQCG